MNSQQWRLRFRLPLAVLSGGLLLLAYPPADVRFAAWVALVPLLLALRGASARAGALCGLAAGLAFFGGVVYWIASFGYVAWAPLVVVLALSWSLFGWFGAWASHGWAGRMLGTPLLFAGAELLRSRYPLGGFAWGLLGTTQHSGLPLLPLARVGGVLLVGIAVAIINAAAAEAFAAGRIWKRASAVLLAAGVAAGASGLPLGLAGPVHGRIEVAAAQVNVRSFGFQRGQRVGPEDERILDDFIAVSEGVFANPPDLMIWPENVLDHDPITDPSLGGRVSQTVSDMGVPLLVGAILDVDQRHFRNSLLLYDQSGEVVRRYDKQHLVPFGEYVPWPSLRDRIGALDQVPFDGVPGPGPVILDVGGARIGGVICFESTFPHLVRGFVREGAEMIVVATNNASFGHSTASAEHLAQSQMRAVEQGRVVVHAAISGISAIVEPDGTVRQKTELFEPDIIRASVPLTAVQTPYGRFGDAIDDAIAGGAALTALSGFAGMVDRRRRRRERGAMEEFDWGPPVPDPSAADPESEPAADPESGPAPGEAAE